MLLDTEAAARAKMSVVPDRCNQTSLEERVLHIILSFFSKGFSIPESGSRGSLDRCARLVVGIGCNLGIPKQPRRPFLTKRLYWMECFLDG